MNVNTLSIIITCNAVLSKQLKKIYDKSLVKIQSIVVRKEQSDYEDGNCFNIIVGFSNRYASTSKRVVA